MRIWSCGTSRPAAQPWKPRIKLTQRELLVLDELARERARQVLTAAGGSVDSGPLRARLRELDVINPHAFIPGARPRPR